MNNRARAFTLSELMVVVLILGLLLSILLPTVHRGMSLAQEKNCNANLSVIGKAIQAYYLQNNDLLPMNDTKDWGRPDNEEEEVDFLPGTNSTKRWWCNKIYPLGHRDPSLYKCSSDSLHASSGSVVQCSYGFNETLTDPNSSGGDAITTSLQIHKPIETILIGHCSPEALDKGLVRPGINESIVDDGSKWPKGHVAAWDEEAKESLGRAGFLMASGDVKVFTFAKVKKVTDDKGGLRLFHTH